MIRGSASFSAPGHRQELAGGNQELSRWPGRTEDPGAPGGVNSQPVGPPAVGVGTGAWSSGGEGGAKAGDAVDPRQHEGPGAGPQRGGGPIDRPVHSLVAKHNLYWNALGQGSGGLTRLCYILPLTEAGHRCLRANPLWRLQKRSNRNRKDSTGQLQLSVFREAQKQIPAGILLTNQRHAMERQERKFQRRRRSVGKARKLWSGRRYRRAWASNDGRSTLRI